MEQQGTSPRKEQRAEICGCPTAPTRLQKHAHFSTMQPGVLIADHTLGDMCPTSHSFSLSDTSCFYLIFFFMKWFHGIILMKKKIKSIWSS